MAFFSPTTWHLFFPYLHLRRLAPPAKRLHPPSCLQANLAPKVGLLAFTCYLGPPFLSFFEFGLAENLDVSAVPHMFYETPCPLNRGFCLALQTGIQAMPCVASKVGQVSHAFNPGQNQTRGGAGAFFSYQQMWNLRVLPTGFDMGDRSFPQYPSLVSSRRLASCLTLDQLDVQQLALSEPKRSIWVTLGQ